MHSECSLAHEVQFVVIGGVAGRLWGSTIVTNDLDVCAERSRPNLERLAAALTELHARLRDVPEDVIVPLDADTLSSAVNATFTTDAGDLDVIGAPAGHLAFAELAEAASDLSVGDGQTVRIVALADLIHMKRAAGRPKDLLAVEILEALQLEIEGIAEPPAPLDG